MSRSRFGAASRFRSSASSERLSAALAALAVALACFDDGGFSGGSRERFAAVAGLAALAAWRADRDRARAAIREPVLWVLAALAALGALSGAWTVGYTPDAVDWAVATAGLAALAFATAVVTRGGREVRAAALWIALVAVAMALIGIYAAATADPPLAHRAAGLWRPAGTFQYSPALALLIVCALPPLLAAMCRARGAAAIAACGFGGAVAGVTLSLAESRTQLAFAVLVALALLARPARVRCTRGELLAAMALVTAAGLGAYAAAGGYVPVTPPPDDGERLLGLGVVLAAATAAWVVTRAALRRGAPLALVLVALIGTGTVAAVAKPAPRIISSGVVAPGERAPRPAAPPRDLHPIRDQLLHGRLGIWGEALETFAERPLHGAGADAYAFAADGRVFFAHSLPLELAAELGVGGLLLALGLYAAIARALWRRRGDPALGPLGAAAIAFPAANLVDWPWHLAGTGAVWALAFGAILGARGATKPRH